MKIFFHKPLEVDDIFNSPESDKNLVLKTERLLELDSDKIEKLIWDQIFLIEEHWWQVFSIQMLLKVILNPNLKEIKKK